MPLARRRWPVPLGLEGWPPGQPIHARPCAGLPPAHAPRASDLVNLHQHFKLEASPGAWRPKKNQKLKPQTKKMQTHTHTHNITQCFVLFVLSMCFISLFLRWNLNHNLVGSSWLYMIIHISEFFLRGSGAGK